MQSIRVLVCLSLVCVIYKCAGAPLVDPTSGEDAFMAPDSMETYAGGGGRAKVREGRFLKELFYSSHESPTSPYYSSPYYYNYGAPAPSYYRPVFQYRQARKKRKRLFVPNFWG